MSRMSFAGAAEASGASRRRSNGRRRAAAGEVCAGRRMRSLLNILMRIDEGTRGTDAFVRASSAWRVARSCGEGWIPHRK
jgi:hypothetical protein